MLLRVESLAGDAAGGVLVAGEGVGSFSSCAAAGGGGAAAGGDSVAGGPRPAPQEPPRKVEVHLGSGWFTRRPSYFHLYQLIVYCIYIW